MTACEVAAYVYERGVNVTRDLEAMKSYELRACTLGSGRGCLSYGNNFRSGPERDLERAIRFYEEGCALGLPKACMRAAWVQLGNDDDTGAPRDAEAARRNLETACNAGKARACAVTGDLHAVGIGLPFDPELAAASYRRACDEQIADACHNLEDSTELWLSSGVEYFFEVVDSPDPEMSFFASPGWSTKVVTRFCLTKGSTVPERVDLAEPSNLARIDLAVRETVEQWRFRPRAEVPPDKTLCFRATFNIVHD